MTAPAEDGCTARLHGTLWAYRRRGCRCPAARQIAAEQRRRYPRRTVAGRRPAGRPQAGATVNQRLVDQAVAGLHVDLNPLELAAAIAEYDVNGRTAAAVARWLGCSERTVQRHRAQRRASGAVA